MRKIQKVSLILISLLLLAGCSKKDNLEPVSIGNIAFDYNAKIWEYSSNSNSNGPMEFKDKKNNTVSIFVSQESTYQHPLEMINFMKSLISNSEGFNIFLEPTKIEVNGTPWYEFGYSYKDGDTVKKIYQRYYGKYYNAASVYYTSTEQNYDTGYEEALKMMSTFVTTDVTNEENEKKAREFLVGEWETGNGYLVMKDDGSYEWYRDKDKDKNNMHYGTYGCDIENETMTLKEGDGIYLVLFPESLTINGATETIASYKMDYIISFDKKEDNSYEMVNMSSYALYNLIKQ